MPWEPTNVERDRLEKLARLEELNVDPYPPRVERTHTTAILKNKNITVNIDELSKIEKLILNFYK